MVGKEGVKITPQLNDTQEQVDAFKYFGVKISNNETIEVEVRRNRLKSAVKFIHVLLFVQC